ncbi:transcriptional activator RfaH [Arsenicitalea aurantiaca]|uniref:Transcriptional activator RfaH n=1 Tax=Arsenicitalea aurantiaca TaxID=1783274 RepID=A0A433X7C6_9HYPH|nr:transcriptional activator RfaH [Arsenicitalea aurantiaca]RUT29976.1 transcriptional activator RfaH [Arsenicitalea aurantiaca]
MSTSLGQGLSGSNSAASRALASSAARAEDATAAARWYVVQTNANKERLAVWHLEDQGFVVFAPRLQKTIRHARQFRSVSVPLFPGYIFVQIELSTHRWRSINGTFGVRSLVMSGDRPLPVSELAMAELQQVFGNSKTRLELSSGQQVKVIAGPLSGFSGALDRLDGPERVRVLMGFIGRSVPVTLSRNDVASAN